MTIAEGVQVADHLLATDLAEQQTDGNVAYETEYRDGPAHRPEARDCTLNTAKSRQPV
jgi:hypothetical protein